MTDQLERLDLTSLSITADRIARLREDFPEVFREGTIDFDALQRSLGEWIDPGQERFGLSWPGKAECMRVIQAPATGTLLPMREESVDFDTTQHVIIEGENLEVLKLLQKSYAGKVKMIYIDPPYNTGGEFIYPDNFREGLPDYLKYSGQVDDVGFKISTNVESGGRYHSNWLNMMHPRLFLARNLLNDEGFIIVSIDDHEVHNLRPLMNEVFGETNFVAQMVWRSRVSEDTRAKTGISNDHEYLICYRRSESAQLRGADIDIEKFANPDDDPRGPWRSADLTGLATRESRPNLHYDLVDPETGFNYGCPPKGWRYETASMHQRIVEGRVLFPKNGNGRPRHKLFLNELRSRFKNISSIVTSSSTADGTRELNRLLGDGEFPFPKPTALLQLVVQQTTYASEEPIILDFFAGSGTLAHAVIKQNVEDHGNRRYILVQLPERTEGTYSNIAEIARERVRRAGKAIAPERSSPVQLKQPTANSQQPTANSQSPQSTLDLGFRAYRLTTSSFKPWDSDPETIGDIGRQLELYADNVLPDRTSDDILTELLLATGFELTTPVERLTLAGQEVFSVAEGALLVCLDRKLTLEVIEAMAARDSSRIICLDAGFQGNDQLKVNANQIIKSRTREGHEPIVFKVV